MDVITAPLDAMSQPQLDRMEAMLRVLVDMKAPHVTTAEIRRTLGMSARTATRWIAANKLRRVGRGRFLMGDFVCATQKEKTHQ